MEGMRAGLVNPWLYRALCRWPLAVATDLGKWWQMLWDVSPSQVEKNPASMTSVQVLDTGLNHALCRYVAMSRFFVSF